MPWAKLDADLPTRVPWSDAQLGKLWVEAAERGWKRDQVYGRAGDINPLALDKQQGLHALDMREMSRLIDAIMHEAPWTDPRQMTLDLGGA